jgi:uncharacterized cupin superfamily protein
MSERRHKHVVNIDEVAVRDEARGGFGFKARRLGAEAGSFALGCSHFEIPPGKTAFPYHYHSATDEAVYVLEGTGTVRLGDAKVQIRAGDFVAMPAGPDAAHQVTNTGSGPLRLLALSSPGTPVTLDVLCYPDSKKVAYASGVDPTKGIRGPVWIRGLHKEQPPVDYYLDEPLADK